MNLQKTNFYNKILNNFKESTALSLLPSFISTKKKQKFIEGKIYVCKFSNKLFFIDFGYKYEIEIFSHELNLRLPVLNSITKQCNYVKKYSSIQFNIMVFHNFFLNNFDIKTKKLKLSTKILFYILLKQKRKRIFLKGRIIDIIRGGFSVGVCGYITFLPKSHAFFKSLGKLGFFYLLSANFARKSFIVSQRHIHKTIKRRLLKLGSRLVYIKNQNYSKKNF
jgi:ribosomal protein S1